VKVGVGSVRTKLTSRFRLGLKFGVSIRWPGRMRHISAIVISGGGGKFRRGTYDRPRSALYLHKCSVPTCGNKRLRTRPITPLLYLADTIISVRADASSSVAKLESVGRRRRLVSFFHSRLNKRSFSANPSRRSLPSLLQD